MAGEGIGLLGYDSRDGGAAREAGHEVMKVVFDQVPLDREGVRSC